MKEILIEIILISLISAVASALIPNGGIKNSAEKLISFATVCAILSAMLASII